MKRSHAKAGRHVRFFLAHFVALAVLLLLATGTVSAAGAPEAPDTVTVIGTGEVSAEPDQATITLGVQLYNESAQAASTELFARMDSVTAALRGLGIPDTRIQTTNYSIYFERDYQTPLPREGADATPAGIYRVENLVRVAISDTSGAAAIVGAAIEAGANLMYGISFSFSDASRLDAEAQQLAMSDASERAALLAAGAGRSLGPVIRISEVVDGTSVAYESRMMADGAGGGFEPGSTRYLSRIQVTYKLE